MAGIGQGAIALRQPSQHCAGTHAFYKRHGKAVEEWECIPGLLPCAHG